MKNPFGFSRVVLATCSESLAVSPLRAVQDAAGYKGWVMHVVEPTQPSEHLGIYSTSFAIQLLTRSESADTEKIAKPIRDGFKFLNSEFEAWKNLNDDNTAQTRQRKKKDREGYTDFDLTLKNASILDAFNALTEIRNKHDDYGRIFKDYGPMLDSVAGNLHQGVRSVEAGGVNYQGWSWATKGNMVLQPEIIPTAYAINALTHPSLRSTSLHFDGVKSVAATLTKMLEEKNTIVHRVIAFNALCQLAKNCNEIDIPHLSVRLRNEILEAADKLEEFPQQETHHYTVNLESNQTVNSKPWIWIFPQLEIATARMNLEDSVSDQVEELSARLVRNIESHEGSVKFMSTQPMTHLANLRTYAFLHRFATSSLSNKYAIARFSLVRARLYWRTVATKYNGILVIALAILIWHVFGPSVAVPTALMDSSGILASVVKRALSVWPLWIIGGTIGLISSQGTFKARLFSVCKYLALTVLGGILVNLLSQ